jgi:Tat protein secretion system quality control protein TatD with DNase activity
VPHVGQHIADLRDIAVGEVAAATTANARDLFALTH